MAKTLTAAEIKSKKTDLKAALKMVDNEHGKFVSDHKAAVKARDAAKKDAEKAVAAAQKLVDKAEKALGKATAAADKGREKIAGQIAALTPAE